MSRTRWNQVEELFHRAADLKGDERLALLESACADDPELRREVESLLAADDQPGAVVADAVSGAAVELSRSPGEDATLVGKRVGRYSILELVGKGGMGAVYRAMRDDEVRMEVAVKLLKRGTDTDAALRHFRRERQILAALQHPNIARLLDAGATDDGLPYFVMEFVDGRPLLDYACSLPIRKRLQVFRAICAAVQYAHQNLVVHRDLKPGNILVTEDGTPKLLDFGIAKLLDPDSPEQAFTVTAAGARLLTPDYASPEQVRGEAVTTVSDVYSLGVVLYELLTGERPYRIETHSPAAIEEIVCRQPPKRPSAANPQVDEDLDNIVLVALRKEPARRYASVEQFSEDIRRYLEGKPVRARKDTLVYHTTKFVRRNRLAVGVALAIVAGLLTGVVVVRRQARRAEYRFQQVRKLAGTVLFNLEPEIEPLAGSTKAREVLVNTSLEYLDSLANEAETDPELQLELATAYEKIGDVQGNSRYSNLGHPEAAVRSYNKALAIARKLKPTAPVLKLIAETHYKMGSVQYWGLGRSSDAMENLRMATRVADSIPQQTSDPAYRVRAEAYGFLGDTTAFMDSEQAREPLGIALKLAREWVSSERTPPSRYFLALSLERWGTTLMGTGDLLTARDSLFEAAAILGDLLQQQPDNAVWKRELGVVEERIGMVEGHPQYFNLGDSKSAAEWFQKLVAGEEQLLAADANNLRAREDLSEALADLAASLRDSDPARAERLYRRSFELSESFLAANPSDWEAFYNQSFDRIGFASALRREGKQGQAAQEIDRAVKMLGILVQRDADNPDNRQLLASALQQRAVQRLDQRNVSGAERDLGDALELLEALHRSMPRRLTVIRDLADCYQTAGDVDASRSDWGAAETGYRKSMELWDSWKTIGVSSSYDHLRRERAAKLAARAASHKKSSPR